VSEKPVSKFAFQMRNLYRYGAASLRGLQRHAVTSSQSQRADPTTGQSEQPAASLIVALLQERMAAAQRAWWGSAR
jgi:hypothetical protein